jgi:hypothetical protein
MVYISTAVMAIGSGLVAVCTYIYFILFIYFIKLLLLNISKLILLLFLSVVSPKFNSNFFSCNCSWIWIWRLPGRNFIIIIYIF